MNLRRLGVLGVTAVVACLLSAQALPADEQTNLGIRSTGVFNLQTLVASSRMTAGRPFLLVFVIERAKLPTQTEDEPISTAGDRSATYAVDLTAGLEVQPATQLELPDFRGQSSACTSGCGVQIPAGQLSAARHMVLRAATPGTYSVTVRLTSTSYPDPAADNDTHTREFTVVVPAVTAGKAVAKPAIPRVGRAYSVSLPLTVDGAQVTPTSVRCSAKVGKRAIRGAAAKLAGRARCTWKVPRGTAGKTLRVKLTATADGKTFRAAKSARVR